MEPNQQEAVVKKYHFFRAPWLGTSNQFSFREKKVRVYEHTMTQVNVCIDPEMKDEYEEQLKNHKNRTAIEPMLVNDPETARFLIGYTGEGYYLTETHTAFSPIFGYHKNIPDLIQLVLLVTNWHAELERNNNNSGIRQDDVILEFEKLEGVERSLIENQQGRSVHSSDPLVLEYKNNQPPALRCKAYSKRQDLHLSALLLDSHYGITPMANMKLPGADKPDYLNYSLDKNKLTWYLLSIDPGLIDSDNSAVVQYVRFIISTRRLNTGILAQPRFKTDVQLSASFIRGTKKRVLNVQDADWMAFNVPVKIIFSNASYYK